ncbi:Glyco_hydro_17 domain-containing protein/X8 domain-containing protein [Cephalotus follicularis]|uniref:glucan endo-1,3-beta-D-glucosidase n=1 Tax=Cephalotus follicularis TaxID=3775 RepID=A0A1Q3ATF1_CEPFO|nr:Glyco_hydro_17 domain-containing protein/X8 domain-containing protein [Cephalotus follicularis]
MGINYGRLGNNLPSPYQSVELIKTMKAGRVKLYDANPEILRLLSGTKIQVSIMISNNEIISLATNKTLADQWVLNNVRCHYPQTMIRFILVGNEVMSYFSDYDRTIWYHLVPAMRRIKNSLKAQNIRNIKVGTPLAMDALQTTFPPSNGMFRSDISYMVMTPLLRFLNQTKSFFFIDVYPYFPWSTDFENISLDFALFTSNTSYTDPGSGLIYHNLLDQMLDSITFAMAKLGYPNIRIAISETGWPNAGDIDQIGANIYNAATYNRNLIQKMTSKPALGTPARPGVVIPTFIFSLYDENQKVGPGTERHWGILHPSGEPNYEIDLTGKRLVQDYPPLPVVENNKPYRGKVWCVVAGGANMMELDTALAYACSQGNETCAALVPGKECYEPLSVFWHASYAFSSYWAQFRRHGATCYFNGLAAQTTSNPSKFYLWVLLIDIFLPLFL